MHHVPTSSAVRALLLLPALWLGACKSPTATATAPSTDTAAGASTEVAQELTATAQIVALDPAARLVTLRSEDGRLRQVRTGETVRNFDQLKIGDTLRVRYQAKLLATVLPAGESLRPAQAAAVAARAAKGARPGAGVEVAVSVRVRIESIDAPRDLVVFSPASGELIAHRIGSNTGREFVRKLKVGDLVQLDYEQALALAIDKLAE